MTHPATPAAPAPMSDERFRAIEDVIRFGGDPVQQRRALIDLYRDHKRLTDLLRAQPAAGVVVPVPDRVSPGVNAIGESFVALFYDREADAQAALLAAAPSTEDKP